MRLTLLALMAGCIFGGTALGQDEIPTKVNDQNRAGDLPFSSSIGTQIEHVDVGTATLNVEIPLIKTPGRGMGSELSFHWNSNFLVMAPRTDGLGRPFWIWTFGAGSGWQTNSTSDSRVFQQLHCTIPAPGNWSAYTNYIYTDPSGGMHPLAIQSEWAAGSCAGPGNQTNPDLGAQGEWGIAAGTGLNGYNFSVLNADGSKEDLQDTNGNQKSTSMDTLGRIPWTVQNLTNQTKYIHSDSGGTPQTYTVNWQTITVTTSFGVGSCGYGAANEIVGQSRTVISSIVLPNGRQYAFQYDGYGDITRIDLPTGAYITYTWAILSNCRQTRRYVATRTETVDGVASTWSFALSTTSDTVTYPAVGSPPIQNQSVFTRRTKSSSITDAKIYAGSATGTPVREYVMTYTSDSNPFADELCYNDIFPPPGTDSEPVGLRLTGIKTILQNGLQKQTQFDYETFTYRYYPYHCTDYGTNNQQLTYTTSRGNVTEIREYDWGQGAPGGLIRKTDKTYLHNSDSTYLTYNIVNKVLQDTILDGFGNQKAQTQYEFDNYVAGQNALVSTSSSPAPQHDYTNYSSGFRFRGNATRVKRWRDTDGALLTTTYTYDDLGNIRAISDPLGHTTTYGYTDSWSGSSCPPVGNSYAYVTSMTNALGQQVQRTLYQCTGLLQARKDQNDINAARAGTTYSYDWLGRVTQKNTPDSGQTTTCYSDDVLGAPCHTASSPEFSTVTTKIAATPTIINNVATSISDGLGRTRKTQLTSDPDGTTYARTAYDVLGREVQQWNPTRCDPDVNPSSCPGEQTFGITTSNYDALNRVVTLIPPDGTSTTNNVSTTFDVLLSTPLSNCTTTTDQAGKTRKTCSDGLDRVTTVWEDPSGLNYETDYTYDTLGNLLTVNQKGSAPSDSTKWRTRTFTYDSLSRLLTANNPESGTIIYTYDANGNVTSKVAPQANQTGSATTTTSYCYDVLNRLQSKAHTAQSCPLTTPAVTYGYDGVAASSCTPPSLADGNPIGRRTSMCDASGTTSWAHDSMGRVLTEKRTITGSTNFTKTTTYQYNLDGSLWKLTYPGTGNTVTYTVGGAGRATAAQDTTNSFNYVTNAKYAPFGGLATFKNGASVNVTDIYNIRLQPCWMYATTGTALPGTTSCTGTATTGTIQDVKYNFGLGTNDNGNVVQIVNNRDGNRTQNFLYDSLNRIAQAYTNGPNWGETFSPNATAPGVLPTVPGIDAWGNLTNRSGVTGKTYTELLNVAPASTKNQLNGYCNDSAGNLVLNTPCPQPPGTPFTPTYNYDAENRLVFTSGYAYFYDGDGNRVKKCTSTAPSTCQSGATGTLYWNGTGSDSLSEGDLTGATIREYIFFNGKRVARLTPPSTVRYFFSDHLGSHTLITSSTGTIQKESDYYPYGGEIAIVTGPSEAHRFTSKERDAESGLDNFGARYDASSLGRFMSPDPFIPFNLKKAKFQDWISNPQHWNKYAYALNNPLLYVDPSGMTETIYYWTGKLNEEQKKFFAEHKTEILNGIAAKLKEAGIKDVVFKDGSTLTNAQVSKILDAQPKGVAFLNFADNKNFGKTVPSSILGGGDGLQRVVFLGNLESGKTNFAFRIEEVSAHELGHGMGFYSRGETMSFIEFWNKDLMNEGQSVPNAPRHFDMSVPQNKKAVDEINSLPEYSPPK